ncbi:MAG: GIY-YIG nuclease family protein [Anaerolineales bacterium]
MAFVYMVECADGTYYTGWTVDLAARVAAHNAGTGARYTRSRRPVRLVYWERAADMSSALRREAALRRMSHADKRRLAATHAANSEEGQP